MVSASSSDVTVCLISARIAAKLFVHSVTVVFSIVSNSRVSSLEKFYFSFLARNEQREIRENEKFVSYIVAVYLLSTIYCIIITIVVVKNRTKCQYFRNSLL